MINKVNQSPAIATPAGFSSIQGISAYITIFFTTLMTVLRDFANTINSLIDRTSIARTTSDFSIASTTTLTNIPGLSVILSAGHTYSFVAHLFIKSGASFGGPKAGINGTATATDIRYDGWALDTGASGVHGYTQAAALGVAVAGGLGMNSDLTEVEIYGAITVNVGGTLTVQIAQASATPTAIVVARGSHFIVHDMT